MCGLHVYCCIGAAPGICFVLLLCSVVEAHFGRSQTPPVALTWTFILGHTVELRGQGKWVGKLVAMCCVLQFLSIQ